MNDFIQQCPPVLFSLACPAPCFVLDVGKLQQNCALLNSVQQRTGVRILLALKAFSAWCTFPYLSATMQGSLQGVCASSVDEARLGREEFGGEVHAFAAAFTTEEIQELLTLADYITFNSVEQWCLFRPLLAKHNLQAERPILCGLRINPEHSEGAVEIYNPCSPGSRLGIRAKHFQAHVFAEGISGLHFHTLCEQGAEELARTLEACEQRFAPHLACCHWINMGGGHHITKAGYNLELLCQSLLHWQNKYGATIYLEPGEAVALDAGWLTATVLDIVEADLPVAILDLSAACHMPDVLEMPYRPNVLYQDCDKKITLAGEQNNNTWTCRLAGKSCLAGDVIGTYSFVAPLTRGQRLVFCDMAIYSMVKTTTFNGLRLPSIALYQDGVCKIVKTFGYADFKTRLS